jgi:hypothetical protein
LFRGQNPENKQVAELMVGEGLDGPRLVGDLVAPVGLNYQKVEAVALVTQLDGTGSDPPPSPMKDELKKEMQTHMVRRPDDALSTMRCPP